MKCRRDIYFKASSEKTVKRQHGRVLPRRPQAAHEVSKRRSSRLILVESSDPRLAASAWDSHRAIDVTCAGASADGVRRRRHGGLVEAGLAYQRDGALVGFPFNSLLAIRKN